MAEGAGSRLLVVFIPDIVQLNNQDLQMINHWLEHICRKYRIEYLDMTPVFEQVKEVKSLYLLPYDAHTSPRGHEIIASEINGKIREMYKE